MDLKGFGRKAVSFGKGIGEKIKGRIIHTQSTQDHSENKAVYTTLHKYYFPEQEPYEFNSLENVSYQHYKRARDLDSRGRLTSDVDLMRQAIKHYNLSSRLTPSVAVTKEDRDLLKTKLMELFGKQELIEFEFAEKTEEEYRNVPAIYACDICTETAGEHETVCMKCGFPLMDEKEFDKEKIKKLEERVKEVEEEYEIYTEDEIKFVKKDVKKTTEQIKKKSKKELIVEKIKKANELFDEDRYEDALEAYNKIIKINPDIDDAEVLFNTAYCYNEMKKKEKALEYYRKVIELNPKDDTALNNIALILDEIGRKKKALEYFNKALEINPKDKDAKKYIKEIEKGLKKSKKAKKIEI